MPEFLRNVPPLVFDAPWLLPAAVLLPFLVWWIRRDEARRRQVRLARFAAPTALPRLIATDPREDRTRTRRLMLVAMLAGAALAGPRWGRARGPANARGIDMAIAIDASLSMLAPDDRPSRLERVKQEVRRLRAMAPADRVALLAFAGRSYILTPLTADDGAIELFLENLDPDVVGQAGSALSRAIRQGTELLLASDGRADRALVVLSDGESFEPTEEIVGAATEAGARGVSLVTVGFGTIAGSTIPIRDGPTLRLKEDDNGVVVVSRYTPDVLAQAATAAKGTFIPAEASDKAARIRGALRALRTARRRVDTREDHVPRFLWLVLPATLLLAWDSWRLVRRPRRRRGAGVAAGVVPAVLVSCAQPPDPAVLHAEGRVAEAIAAYRQLVTAGDSSSRTGYNLGTALIGADSLVEAAERLEGVRRVSEGEVQFRARFNAGLAHLRSARLPGNPQAADQLAAARAAYRALLSDRPATPDAKWNYELALRPPPPPRGGGGGGEAKAPPEPRPQPPGQGALDRRQAEALLNAAARDERDVQGRKPRAGRTPPRGKDW